MSTKKALRKGERRVSYGLAKELKDAGFRREGFSEREISILIGEEAKEKDVMNSLLLTELSELMEACGDARNGTGWLRLSYTGKVSGDMYEAEGRIDRRSEGLTYHTVRGSTPEEAVAKLWIAINKKPSFSSFPTPPKKLRSKKYDK